MIVSNYAKEVRVKKEKLRIGLTSKEYLKLLKEDFGLDLPRPTFERWLGENKEELRKIGALFPCYPYGERKLVKHRIDPEKLTRFLLKHGYLIRERSVKKSREILQKVKKVLEEVK